MEMQADYVCHEFDENDATVPKIMVSVDGYTVEVTPEIMFRAVRLGCRGLLLGHEGSPQQSDAMRGLIEREMSGAEARVQVLALSEPSPHDWPIRTFVNVLDLLQIAEEGVRCRKRPLPISMSNWTPSAMSGC